MAILPRLPKKAGQDSLDKGPSRCLMGWCGAGFGRGGSHQGHSRSSLRVLEWDCDCLYFEWRGSSLRMKTPSTSSGEDVLRVRVRSCALSGPPGGCWSLAASCCISHCRMATGFGNQLGHDSLARRSFSSSDGEDAAEDEDDVDGHQDFGQVHGLLVSCCCFFCFFLRFFCES